jgi:hypothetical protein
LDLREASSKISPSARHPWELARLEVIRNLIRDIVNDRPEFTVLDIGCGDLFLVGTLSSLFPSVRFIAVDSAFSKEQLEGFRNSLEGKNIHVFDSLESATAGLTRKVDLILLLDVVEHIDDDAGFLAGLSAAPFVGPATKFLITVPAFNFLFSGHDRFLGHYRRYTRKSLLSLLGATGMVSDRSGYFFTSLLPLRMLGVLSEKLFGERKLSTGLVDWRGGSLKTKLLRKILLSDFWLSETIRRFLGLSLPGLSVYSLCRRSA